MANAALFNGDAILRAYVNLKAVRDDLPAKNVFQKGLYTMFNNALEELQEAGVDVREWRLPPGSFGCTHADEFRARIDAILMYFSIQQQKTKIGFHR